MLRDRTRGCVSVETHSAATEARLVEDAEYEIGVSRRRQRPAAAVACRSRDRTCTLRADQQRTVAHLGDAPAPGADRGDVDRREPNVGAGDRDLRPHERRTVDEHPDVEAGSPNVDGQHVLESDGVAGALAADYASGWP